jgi:hypothetical protein
MTEKMPEAAGKAGQTNPAASEDAPEPPRTDDELRRYAAEQLAEHLSIGVDLAARCHNLSLRADTDKVGPIHAASRLMQANARIAEALATVAQVERRRRTISETIQKPDPKQAELNSKLEKEKVDQEQLTKFWQRMDEHVENSVRARLGQEGAEDRIAFLLKKQKQKLAYAERRLAGEEDPHDVYEDDEDENDG